MQTSREPAEDRRVFSESDAPDEVHVFGVLFQPSICSQCTHAARVKKNSGNHRHKDCQEEMLQTALPKNINMFGVYHSEELGEYMESKGASSPGILTLTTSLSKPFTRLERYPALLKELDRHMQVKIFPCSKCFKFKFTDDKNNNVLIYYISNILTLQMCTTTQHHDDWFVLPSKREVTLCIRSTN